MPHHDIDAAVSERIRIELAKRRMTLRELAKLSEISQDNLSRRINRRSANGRPAAGWRLQEVAAIAKALGLPWDAFAAPDENGTAA